MTIVHGKIESLKRIRETLEQHGITRFTSIGQLNKFIKNYDREKGELFYRIEQEFELELDALQAEALQLQKRYDSLKTNAETRLDERISKLIKRCETLESRTTENVFLWLGELYLRYILLGVKFILEKGYNGIIWLQTFRENKPLREAWNKVELLSSNSQSIISTRFATTAEKLEHTKSVFTDINPLIAGAIGEHLVSKELEKLSDAFVLFNDFSLSLSPPIYNKKKKDRIYSIQIDHLLVTSAGIFIIETKNWSKDSIERLDLRSPIKQIQRTSFALFVLLNGNKSVSSTILNGHHWGNQKLPVRNVIAMINHKPKARFSHVAIKKLQDLNNYITYFEPIFDDTEIRNIAEYLGKLKI